MKFFTILLANLLLLISCDALIPDQRISLLGPVLETVNRDGNLEYIGRVINNSEEKVENISLRYIVKDKEDNVVEAVTLPVSGLDGNFVNKGEIVLFQFSIRSNPKSIFNKEFSLHYE